MKRSLVYDGLKQFVLEAMQCYCNYLVIALHILWADRNGACHHNWDQRWKNISLANTANRRDVTPFRFSFCEFSVKENISFHYVLPQWILYHNLLIKSQKSCYTAALVEHFVAPLPEVISLRAAHVCSMYVKFLVFQSLANFRSKYQVPVGQRLDIWMSLTNQQIGPVVIRKLDKEPN